MEQRDAVARRGRRALRTVVPAGDGCFPAIADQIRLRRQITCGDEELAVQDPEFTLAAGPAVVSPRVLAALSQPLTHHSDPLFLERFRRAALAVLAESRRTQP